MNYFRLFTSTFLITAFAFTLAAETLFLKNGTVIDGTVVENTEKELVFRDKQKKIHRIPQKDVSMLIKSKKYKFNDNNSNVTDDASIDYSLKLNISPGIIIPLGTLSKTANTGYGIESKISSELFLHGFELGVDASFYYMEGKNLEEERNLDFERFFIIPFFISAGYAIELADNLYIIPELSPGGIFIDSRYFDYSKSSKIKHFKKVEPALKTGISLRCALTDSLSVFFSSGYVITAEENGIIHFAVINSGIGYNF